MKLLNGLVWFVCTAIFILLGTLFLIFSAHLREWLDISFLFAYLQNQPNLWLISGLTGILIIVITLTVSRAILGGFQRERTIAFNNPGGQVTISLSAIEDLIRRVTRQINEVKDIRCNVKASKKGIETTARITLWSDANIPDATDRVQSLVKSKVQSILGIEDPITCTVHIAKIVHREEGKKRRASNESDSENGYHGAIEYGVRTHK